ncbi:MAG: hypothetical protein KY467_02395 [Gemmatimonadetes bacterium]|nr:hypothetical protein [Gemmatimonadota bacterium]
MRTLLPALLAIAVAAPALAQEDGFNPVIQVKYAAPPRAVYLAAMDALEARGVTIRARMLDQALLTLPDFGSAQPGAGDTATVMLVEIEPAGDSTQIVIQARLVTGDGKVVSNPHDRSLARVLVAETMISAAVDTAMDALPPGTGAADPREATDAYGYGRGNPIQVGGGSESGAANQRRWLDALRGPRGEPVRYRRLGSCCHYEANGSQGVLDAYQVTYPGLEKPVVLYMDMYAKSAVPPAPPEGFTAAPPAAPSTD